MTGTIMPVPVGRVALSVMNSATAPTTSGRMAAAISIPRRTQSSSTNSGSGTKAMSMVPMSGKTTPISAATQASDARTISNSSDWRLCGTLPKSSMVAQPRVLLSNRPANRPRTPTSPVMIAIRRRQAAATAARRVTCGAHHIGVLWRVGHSRRLRHCGGRAFGWPAIMLTADDGRRRVTAAGARSRQGQSADRSAAHVRTRGLAPRVRDRTPTAGHRQPSPGR